MVNLQSQICEFVSISFSRSHDSAVGFGSATRDQFFEPSLKNASDPFFFKSKNNNDESLIRYLFFKKNP